ncbi:hypothetical protein JMJ77_0014178 [Colletotrichum scovillei]|uniref:Uncharacterized protein n=1 Tax=Colletotrichum scovillei TaxID=1209932 RepID=A0A9P7R668_9PEZI|nr:hypothetical protein JMJ77_0014178 [Colletotrichum scovillei]KAG7065673.1 hypothetical protein JMJ78_0012420 [Colletotrichum scovillei]KAG7068305.1 hypothetical protein JMJ76_0007995 [Colletotrichum scovillei]
MTIRTGCRGVGPSRTVSRKPANIKIIVEHFGSDWTSVQGAVSFIRTLEVQVLSLSARVCLPVWLGSCWVKLLSVAGAGGSVHMLHGTLLDLSRRC